MAEEEIFEMNASEIIVKLAKKDAVRDVKDILEECSDLEEAKKRVKAMIEDIEKQ